MAKNDIFCIDGVIIELDTAQGELIDGTSVFLGGVEGVKATSSGKTFSPVFYGEDLLNSEDRIQELTFNFAEADNIEVKPGKNGKITGTLKMLLIVS